jgi:hypothetical protein
VTPILSISQERIKNDKQGAKAIIHLHGLLNENIIWNLVLSLKRLGSKNKQTNKQNYWLSRG